MTFTILMQSKVQTSQSLLENKVSVQSPVTDKLQSKKSLKLIDSTPENKVTSF